MQSLRDRREELGFSQTAVAVAIGVSLVSYQNWERGVAKPRENHRIRLEKVLQFGENDEEKNEMEEDQETQEDQKVPEVRKVKIRRIKFNKRRI